MRKTISAILSFLSTALLSGVTLAAPIAITNPGFDATNASDYTFGGSQTTGNPIPNGTYTSNFGTGVQLQDASNGNNISGATATILGWTGSAGNAGVIYNTASFPNGAPTGPGALMYGSLTVSQTLTGIGLLPDSTYTLSANVFDRIETALRPVSIQLKAGSTVLGTASGSTPVDGGGATWSLVYVSPSSGLPVGDLSIAMITSGSGQVAVDNISLDVVTVSTPEPSAVALAVTGMLGLVRLGGRRRGDR